MTDAYYLMNNNGESGYPYREKKNADPRLTPYTNKTSTGLDVKVETRKIEE